MAGSICVSTVVAGHLDPCFSKFALLDLWRPIILRNPPEKDFQSTHGGVDSQVEKIRDKNCLHQLTEANFIGTFRWLSSSIPETWCRRLIFSEGFHAFPSGGLQN